MFWRAELSLLPNLYDAVNEAASAVRGSLRQEADLAFIFTSGMYGDYLGHVPTLVRQHLGESVILAGSIGAGIIGAGREVERQPAVSILAGVLPGVKVRQTLLQPHKFPDLDGSPRDWEKVLEVRREEEPSFLLFADPRTSAIETLVQGLDFAFPGAPKVGGLASGGQPSGGSSLVFSGTATNYGTVVVSLSGNLQLETLVAQGCRPIGELCRITECHENVITQLDGKPAWARLEETVSELSLDDQKLARVALHLGVSLNPFVDAPRREDFLIRNLLGYDRMGGSIQVGEQVRSGQVVRFHLRDGKSASEELAHLLRRQNEKESPRGAILFSCLGRGERLFGVKDHDSRALRGACGDVPMAGFFCNGEIGPVGRETFLHGYTSSFGLFRPKDEETGSVE